MRGDTTGVITPADTMVYLPRDLLEADCTSQGGTSRAVACFLWSILGQQTKQLLGSDDRTRKRAGEAEQVFVAGDKMVGPANESKLEKREVERVAAGWRFGELGRQTHSGAVR